MVTFTVTTLTQPGMRQGTLDLTNSSPVSLDLVATTVPSAIPGTANPAVTPGRWKAVLPGAANYEAFIIVGHCLFALLAGLLGAVAAQWFRRRAEGASQSAQTTTTDPGLISSQTSTA